MRDEAELDPVQPQLVTTVYRSAQALSVQDYRMNIRNRLFAGDPPVNRTYLPEVLRQIRSYLPEVLRQIRSYFPEVLRQIRSYLPEVLLQIRTFLPDPFLSFAVLNGPV